MFKEVWLCLAFFAAANTQDDATACVEKLQQNPTANGCINRYTTLLHSLPEPTFFFLFKTICSNMETFQCLTNYELQCMNPEPIQWAKDVIAQSCEISSKLEQCVLNAVESANLSSTCTGNADQIFQNSYEKCRVARNSCDVVASTIYTCVTAGISNILTPVCQQIPAGYLTPGHKNNSATSITASVKTLVTSSLLVSCLLALAFFYRE